MPRPQRELDPGGGPLVEFARALRDLRAAAGMPKFATMSRRTSRSKTALADAAGGRHLARWETVEDFVRACDADPAEWRPLWERARAAAADRTATGEDPPPDAVSPDAAAPIAVPRDGDAVPRDGDAVPPPETVPPPGTVPPPADPADPTVPAPAPSGGPAPEKVVVAPVPAPRSRWSRGRVFAVGLVVGLLLGVGVVGVGFAISGPGDEEAAPVVTQALRVIEVQNKVAIGPARLVEDSTPAYLSSVPIAYCASTGRSCKVPGTEMASGVALVANCQVQGQRMVNFDLAEEASRDNPYRADSSIWYRATFPDGRTGYLAEVYVNGENRGGLGLPTCGPLPAPTVQPVGGR